MMTTGSDPNGVVAGADGTPGTDGAPGFPGQGGVDGDSASNIIASLDPSGLTGGGADPGAQGGAGGDGGAGPAGSSGGIGDGQAGGAGGSGGDATATFTNTTIALAVTIVADANAGDGGAGGTGGDGLNDGIDPSAGGAGAAGGNGGSASAAISGNTITVTGGSSLDFIGLEAAAASGAGGAGGNGGMSVTDAADIPVSGAGGAGGGSGSASVSIDNNIVTDADPAQVVLQAADTVSLAGAGGIPGDSYDLDTASSAASGQTGAAGGIGSATLSITGNQVVFAGGQVDLSLSIQHTGPAGGGVTQIALSPATLAFDGNDFNGGGGSTLNLSNADDADSVVDVAAGKLSIGGSQDDNTIEGFSTFIGSQGLTTFLDGAGDQTYQAAFAATLGSYEPDIVVFTPGHGDDTINAFANGDMIAFNGFGPVFRSFAAVQAATTDTQQGALIDTPDGGSVLLSGVLSGDLNASEFSFSNPQSVDGALSTSVDSSDFDGRGTSGILFQGVDGTIDDWSMSGASIVSSGVVADPGPSWHAVGTGDFNGDGKSDILFQNDDGSIDIWLMNGQSMVSSALIANPGMAWHAVGVGDFNGDGQSDILFQNDDGRIDIWMMNGQTMNWSGVIANPDTAWHAVGVGDFNGDGKSDIVFQNDDGSIDIWQMNGSTIATSGIVANPGTAWHVVGTGDFNGDGKSDIVLQNNDGRVDIWDMNGSSIESSGVVAAPGPAWHAIGVGDYNGDGNSDILFQNDDGSIDIWQMNGSSIAASGIVANPSVAWQVIGQGGMNFIDGTQSAGTLAGTILNDDFVFTTSLAGAHVITGFDALHDVITLDQTRFGSYDAVAQNETQVAGGTLIDLGNGSTLTLANIAPSALAAKNFV